jgi:hypothetical protein
MASAIDSRFVRRTVWEALTPEQMVARYEEGLSLDDIGTLTGSSGHRVRKILIAHGVTIRPPCRHGSPCPVPRRWKS